MSISIDTIAQVTDFDLLKYLSYLHQGRLRTATLLLYLASLKAFPHWNRDRLYDDCYRKTIFIYLTFL
ncbi:MAG: hypothetical protein GX050_09055 [Firmicutes bacterium]|nr:hypothetical protein [Bacillota bacterium]